MFDILLEAALRATFIAFVAGAVLCVLRMRAAALRHRVWTVVMLAMLALPLAIAWAPNMALRILPSAVPGVALRVLPSEAPVATAPSTDSIGAIASAMESAAGPRLELAPASSLNWRAWLVAIYFTGAALLLARLAIGTVRVRWLAREAAVVNGVLTSVHIATPFTFGLLRPKVLLPEGWQRWSTARLAVVLDHEHAHVSRRDPLVQWLALLNRAVFWFHPLAWWLERRLAALAEEACDAAVIARGTSPADYSEHLLDLARLSGGRPLHLVGMPMPGSGLSTRIAKILDGGIGQPGSRSAVAGAAAVATLAAALLGTITLAQEPAPQRAQEPVVPQRAQEPAAPQRAQEPAVPQGAQEPAEPLNLREVYEVALANDPAVRESGAEYRELTETPTEAPNAVARAAADYDAARQELFIHVAERYFSVFAAESALAAQEAAHAAFSRQREQAERRFDVGLIGITTVQEVRARFDQAAASALTAQGELGAAQEALREVVGEPVGLRSPVVEDLPLDAPNPDNAEAWVATAMQENPVLVSTRLRAESADDNVEAQRSAREDVERVARRTEAETRAAYFGVVSERARVLALQQAVRSSQTAAQSTRAGFDVGTQSTVDVLTAENVLRHAETAYALARYDYALNVLRLHRAAGSLTAQELEETNSWFH